MKRFCCLLLCLPFAMHAIADSPKKSPGISLTKPTKGPFVEVDGKFLVPYVSKIPGTDITFEMVPVPGGTFLMGSPESEEGREDHEGPQFQVKVAPMWVCKHEVRWEEYDQYRLLYEAFTQFEFDGIRPVGDKVADTVTTPTPLHEPTFTFEYGHEPKQPAVTMTMCAAQHYTKWLSAITGQQYRLPTEAEWEYACRAGSKTAFHWGDNTDGADEYVWYVDTSDYEGQKPVGTKNPNDFGLHDMHGNVGEWTVNMFTEDYKVYAGKQPVDALSVVSWPKETVSGAVIRGGCWQNDLEAVRSAARFVTNDEELKDGDPNIPLSPWWFAAAEESRGIGFRIFRSYPDLDKKAITKFWDNRAEDVLEDIENRIEIDGRGKRGLVDKDLPAAVKKLNLIIN